MSNALRRGAWVDCSKKRRYRNKQVAMAAAVKLKLVPYKCGFCKGGWHLTSRGVKHLHPEFKSLR